MYVRVWGCRAGWVLGLRSGLHCPPSPAIWGVTVHSSGCQCICVCVVGGGGRWLSSGLKVGFTPPPPPIWGVAASQQWVLVYGRVCWGGGGVECVGECWVEGVGYIAPRMWGVFESQQYLQQGEQQGIVWVRCVGLVFFLPSRAASAAFPCGEAVHAHHSLQLQCNATAAIQLCRVL